VVEAILPALLMWVRDMNWPIAGTVCRFLASVGAPLAPRLREILDGDDGVWKCWIIGGVIGSNAYLFHLFKEELARIAGKPTPAERAEELDERARDVLAEGPSPWPERNSRSPTGEW
jgi:hypothetical protein